MDFNRGVYLLRLSGLTMAADSREEVDELLDCARGAGDDIELVHAYYGCHPGVDWQELQRLGMVLALAYGSRR